VYYHFLNGYLIFNDKGQLSAVHYREIIFRATTSSVIIASSTKRKQGVLLKVFKSLSSFDFSYRCYVISLGFLFLAFCFPSLVGAQQPTAIIRSVSGGVLVSIQGGSPTLAAVDMVLRGGDTLQTQAGAGVVLRLSEGSEMQLGENTTLDISELSQVTQTGARTSTFKLLAGKVLAFLSSQHQEPGSSFDVETPNALIGVKFSEPTLEVEYDPITNTTTVILRAVGARILNLVTGETIEAPAGSMVVIRGNTIEVTPLKTQVPDEQEQIRTAILFQMRSNVRRIVSDAPRLHRSEISQNPSIIARPNRPGGPQPRTIIVQIPEEKNSR
jgi:hypothetical protein